ncbi:MAG: sodium:solute symporter [Gemmatimonadota bacterium]|nr:MAG: sodium:solute symporter [Gemmatimonadota bacterium]
MSALDYVVLLATILGIAGYGAWHTRHRSDMAAYWKGVGKTRWTVIGLSVMATQASAITFLSTPGQGYDGGLRFVQNYFGLPLALIIVAAIFLPLYRRLNVYTAYEFLGKRFDGRARLLGAALFLLQRGLQAGITIYAPAIVLTTVMGWRLDLTIICTGLVVIAYTVSGGSDAVSVTQKYQIGVIFAGMLAAATILILRLPDTLSMGDALRVAGGFNKLDAVDFRFDLSERYNVWSGIIGGVFLSLSYFGTDQSQVQRYLTGPSLRESRLGLMFNALFKIPMQFGILLLGVLLFVFYQFEPAPVYFNATAWEQAKINGAAEQLSEFESEYATAHSERSESIRTWLEAERVGDMATAEAAHSSAIAAHERSQAIRADAIAALRQTNERAKVEDYDYVFITFVLGFLPHGLIGLLIAVFFAAAFSSLAAELSALGETTNVDFYRFVFRRDASERHYVTSSRWLTIFWGMIAIGFALFANQQENLIEAINIVGSLFYGVVLGMFCVAFFIKYVEGWAVFWGAVVSQALIFVMFFSGFFDFSYLYYNMIGCVGCVALSIALQFAVNRRQMRSGV